MPLRSVTLNKTVRARIQRSLKRLVKEGHGKLWEGLQSPDPLFCMHIQIVPKKQPNSLEFGKPEGLRILVGGSKKVIAAVDFLFRGKGVRLQHIYTGTALKEQVTAINKLEKKYAKEKAVYRLQLVSFIPSAPVYLMAISKNERQFYAVHEGRLKPLTVYRLQEEVRSIIESKQSIK